MGIIVFLTSIGLICYPFISNYLMSLNQSSKIEAYQNDTQKLSDDKVNEELEKARKYNESLYGNVIVTDPFDPGVNNVKDEEYEGMLNFNDSGIMASVEIPAIDVRLPVYHGTSDEALEKGVGHLRKTSLPVGGKGTHAVLTGHTGLSSAKLFTDINQLVEGDVFYIHVLNETLAYKIDQIKTVLPSETSDLMIDPDEDYLTLVTCTPYGINSHRLLVRGSRIPYEEAKKTEESGDRKVTSNWQQEYKNALIVGATAFVVLLAVYILIRRLYKRWVASR